MNMFILYYVHCLSTEMDSKKTTIEPKSMLEYTYQVLAIIWL